MMPATVRTRDKERDPLQHAVWLAATLGPFLPAELLARVTENLDQRRALAVRLAAVCSEVSAGGTVFWNLGADPRRRAFAEMNDAGASASGGLPALIEELAPVPEDHFGRYLRDALVGKAAPEKAEESELNTYYSAYEFVGRSDVGNNPSLARESAGVIDQQAQRSSAERELLQAIGPVFVDRDQQRNALREFAHTGKVSDAEYTRGANPIPGRVPLLFVNGVGGAGKSALIAKLVQELRQSSSGIAATVILDFDRPTLADLNPLELTLELTRQLAVCLPMVAKDLTELRRTALSEFSDDDVRSSNALANYRVNERALYSINSRLQYILGRASMAQQPVLVILDTFEEVVTLGPEYVERVYRWLEDLRDQAQMQGMRVILSGRATPEELAQQGESVPAGPLPEANVAGVVPISDLPTRFAVQMLHESGITDAELAVELVRRFGANPLVLRLLGDYAQQENGQEQVRALLVDEDSSERYKTSVAQRVLYSRILGRIRGDEALRTLASPGLIVRIVTPGIIRKVLAEPCGLGLISQARAQELFSSLARQVWLVRRKSEVSVSHRRDMRTIMLPLANQPDTTRTREELERSVAEIHRLAVSFHRDPALEPRELTGELRRNEALYHELFADPAAALGNPELPHAWTSLQGDLADFRPEVRARLKLRFGGTLTAEEKSGLDADEQRAVQVKLEQQKQRIAGGEAIARAATEGLRESIQALPKIKLRQSPEQGPEAEPKPRPKRVRRRRLLPHDPLKIAAAFAAGEFELIAEAARPLLSDFVDRAVSKRIKLKLERDMTDHYTWYAALSTLAAQKDPKPDWRAAVANELAAMAIEGPPGWNWQRLEDKSHLNVGHYIAAMIVLISQGRGLAEVARAFIGRMYQLVPGKDERRASLSSTAALRIFQMFAVADTTGNGMWKPEVVFQDRLQKFASLLDPKYAKKYDATMAEAQATWQQLPGNPVPRPDVLTKMSPPKLEGPHSSGLANLERESFHETFDLYEWRHPRAAPPKLLRANAKVLPWAALRGMSPDLHPPLIAAVRERFADLQERKLVLDELSRCSTYWPKDFAAASIGTQKRISDTVVASIVHYADRFAALPVLYKGAPAKSRCAKVATLHMAYNKLLASVTRGAAPMSRVPQVRASGRAKVKRPARKK